MAHPGFWQSEDLTSYAGPADDDGDYRWVLRDYEWVPAKISYSKNGDSLIASAIDGDIFECNEENICENIQSLAGLKRLPDDLIHMDDMSEKSIVYTLSERYYQDDIYTAVGDILIAINPFRLLPLYTPLVMQKYLQYDSKDQLKPHPFDISRRAYSSMLRDGKNQAILISGESGAGKTETTKLCMSFLSEAAGSASGIEQKILSANPILEAFGNAKTLRNNNSSRFGKFMNLSFELDGVVVGCGTTNYLLEKSRVHKQAEGERSYHIFYQICRAAVEDQASKKDSSILPSYMRRQTLRELDSPAVKSSRADLSRLNLGVPENYRFLTQSGCTSIPNVCDTEQFHEMEFACIKLGMTQPELNDAFAVCAAILHLGNITFQDSNSGSGGCEVEPTALCKESLEHASNLLGLSAEEISSRLRTRELLVRGEVNSVQLSASQASEARDALCKAMYKNCFDWLVDRTNLAMIDPNANSDINEERGKFRKPAPSNRRYIGILDIFGFEIFEFNGFEQFCINYANEKLQQHFNQHTFKDEMEACERENIPCEKFSFADNQIVLDLIEMKGANGILAILDDECRVPRSSGTTFLNKLKEKHAKHPRFLLAKGAASKDSFAIDHYAGRVFYKVHEFLDKNKDKLGEDLEAMIKRSYLSFEPPKTLEQLRQEEEEKSMKGRAKPKQLTVGGQFKLQLDDLIRKLNESVPHFIRCVKPNDSKQAQFFHGVCVHQQLKQSGAFDALAIRKRGYNFQFKHEVFINRYGPLVRDKTNRRFSCVAGLYNAKDVCEEMVRLLSTLPNMENACKNIQVGNTMVFWKATEDRMLSALRSREIQSQVILVQKVYRGMRVRKQIRILKSKINDMALQLDRIIDARQSDTPESIDSENEALQSILEIKIELRKIPLRTSYEKIIERESAIVNSRIEALNRLQNIKHFEPKDIDEYWLSSVERSWDLHLKNPLAIQLQNMYKELVGDGAEVLRGVFALLDEDEIDINTLQECMKNVRDIRKDTPRFAEDQAKGLEELLAQLEEENAMINDIIEAYSGDSGAPPSDDYVTRIQSFASSGKRKLGKRARAAMQVVDYIVELRELLLNSLRQASCQDPTVKPTLPPPPPPKGSKQSYHSTSEKNVPVSPRRANVMISPQHRRGSVFAISSNVKEQSGYVPPDNASSNTLWSACDKHLKEFPEVSSFVDGADIDPVLKIASDEVRTSTQIIEDCKDIISQSQSSLKSTEPDGMKKTLTLIDNINQCITTTAPFLVRSPDGPEDVGYGMLLDVRARKLFHVLASQVQERLDNMERETNALQQLFAVLDRDVAADDSLSNTSELKQALSNLRALNSGDTGWSYLYPTTEALVEVAEYVLSLRCSAAELQPEDVGEEAAWSEFRQLVSKESKYQMQLLSNSTKELEFYRTMIMNHDMHSAEAEKSKEIESSLLDAIQREDAGQINFLLSQIDGLSDRQLKLLHSTERMEEAIAEGRSIVSKLAEVKDILGAVSSPPYRIAALSEAITAADAIALSSTTSLDVYQATVSNLERARMCVRQAHMSWNGRDVEAMMAAIEECAAWSVEDDEVEYVKYLVGQWREDYGAFLRALIDLNTFLNRKDMVDALNVELNEYYFSLKKQVPEPEPEPENLLSDLPKPDVRSPVVPFTPSAPSKVVDPEVMVDDKNARRGQVCGGTVMQMVKERERLAADKAVVRTQSGVFKRPIPARVVEVDPDDTPTVLSQTSVEGDTYMWYRYRGLRRFADPELEDSRKKFSNEVIPTSVTRLSEPHDITLATTAFKCLLGAMGDRVCNFPPMLAKEFYAIARTNGGLADEAYCQVLKQLSNNPSNTSRCKGISIFGGLIECVLPSKQLELYVEHFLRENCELELLHLLQRRMKETEESGSNVEPIHYAGYLTIIKGKLIKVSTKRWCVVDEDALTIYLSDDPSTRLDALLISQIKDIRVHNASSDRKKNQFPFEIEMKNGAVKTFYTANASERNMWLAAFKDARYHFWLHGKKTH